jgi:hypothetical protein
VNDALGRPGFLAVTLYIPHKLKIAAYAADAPNSVLQLLNSMMNLYRQNYVNDSSRMIKNVRENISLFNNEVAKAKTVADDEYLEKASIKNNSFKIIRYKNEDSLKLYFDMPYQDEYFNHQEILFITTALNQTFKENAILNILPPQPSVYSIIVVNAGYSGTIFVINGEQRQVAENIRLSDRINIRARKPYCYDFAYPEDKTLAEILRENGLSKKEPTVRLELAFIPVRKVINITTRDENGNQLKATLTDHNDKLEIIDSMIWLKGDQMQTSHQILVKAEGYMSLEYTISPYPEDRASETESVTLTLSRKPEVVKPSTESVTPPPSSDIHIYVMDDNGALMNNVEIFAGNIFLGKPGLIERNKIKSSPLVLTFKIRGYEDVQKEIDVNKTSKIVTISKDELKEKHDELKSTQSQSQSQLQSSQPPQQPPQLLPPPQPPEKKNGIVDYIRRYIIWIVAVILLLVLAVFDCKMGLFDKTVKKTGQGKKVVIQLLNDTVIVKMNAAKDTITVKDSTALLKKGVRFSLNMDTIIFPKGDPAFCVSLTIKLSNKKYGGLKQYEDTTIVIEASDTKAIRKIYLRETDTVTKINNLIARLDSTSISFGDIKKIKELNKDKRLQNLKNFPVIDSIFTVLDGFKPQNKKTSTNTNANEKEREDEQYEEEYKNQFTLYSKKINSLKNRLSFKDKLADIGQGNNWLGGKLNGLKEKGNLKSGLKNDVTLEIIFGLKNEIIKK